MLTPRGEGPHGVSVGEWADSASVRVRTVCNHGGEFIDTFGGHGDRIVERGPPGGHELSEIGNVDVDDVDFGQETTTERDQPPGVVKLRQTSGDQFHA
jgi:hypothetical protein